MKTSAESCNLLHFTEMPMNMILHNNTQQPVMKKASHSSCASFGWSDFPLVGGTTAAADSNTTTAYEEYTAILAVSPLASSDSIPNVETTTATTAAMMATLQKE